MSEKKKKPTDMLAKVGLRGVSDGTYGIRRDALVA